MAMATLKYLGDLQTECIHNSSGAKFIADAPVDNRGKGESFSGTDLCATSLGVCAMTLMGICAKENNIDISGATADVIKTMASGPRRIQAVEVVFHMPRRVFSEEEKNKLLQAVETCPVRLTLENVEQTMTFDWAD